MPKQSLLPLKLPERKEKVSPMPASRYLIGSLPWYSVLIVLGAALAIFLASREEQRVGLPKDTILDLALWVLPFGIIGARLYYVAFSWEAFRDNPLSILYVWEGGIAIYGAVIAGFLVLLVFCRARSLPVLLLCDLIAPGLVLAQGIGRWGNFFNMEAYGAAVTNAALRFFPLAVLIPSAAGEPVWHLATFFYESVCDLAIFVFLLWARRRLFRRQGDVFFFYLFLYAAARLVIEDLRLDSLYSSSVRVSQLLSVLGCLSLTVYYLITTRSRPGRLRPLGRVLSVLSLAFGIPVLLYTFHLPVFDALGLRQRLLFLSAFSLLSVSSLFLTYGSSLPSEVLYANRPD